jgi:hypothetical protein
MSKKTFCDVCNKPVGENYDYTIAIGAFRDKSEIAVHMSFAQCGMGPERWVDVDLCQRCKEDALRRAAAEIVKQRPALQHYIQL